MKLGGGGGDALNYRKSQLLDTHFKTKRLVYHYRAVTASPLARLFTRLLVGNELELMTTCSFI